MELPKKKEFREALMKSLPGHKWTVHHPGTVYSSTITFLEATGITTAGKNRTSTIMVRVSLRSGSIEYESMSAGFGEKALWLGKCAAPTLAQSLRGLQRGYEISAADYARHAADIQNSRRM
jgi:hypothetical protein